MSRSYSPFSNFIGQICAEDEVKETWLGKITNAAFLADVVLNSEAKSAINAWSKGEMSGEECIKELMRVSFVEGAVKVGGAVGYFIAGDWGRSIGERFSKAVAQYIVDYLTQSLFGRPRNEALKNAYLNLGVKETASKEEINTAYRKLALKHDPDKGGSAENFYILQYSMEIIREERGGFISFARDMVRLMW